VQKRGVSSSSSSSSSKVLEVPEMEDEEEAMRKQPKNSTARRIHASKRPMQGGDSEEEDEGSDGHLEVEGEEKEGGDWDGVDWEVSAIVKNVNEGVEDVEEEVEGLAPADCRKLLGEIMRYILFMNMNHVKCTTSNISSEVINPTNIKVSADQKRKLLRIVTKRFKHTFGYDLVSSADAPQSAADIKRGPKKKKTSKEDENNQVKRSLKATDNWVLLNLMETAERKQHFWREHPDNPIRGFVMAVLSYIMLNDGSIAERELHEQLKRLGVPMADDEVSKIKLQTTFKDSKSVLKTLEGKAYLTKQKTKEIANDGRPIYIYTYGPRALVEIGLPNILRFMEKITNSKLEQDEATKLLEGSN